MANVTKFTFSKLCKKVEINKDISLDIFLSHIYNDAIIYFMLNKLEIKYLFNYRSILEDEKKYVIDYYQFVPERRDQHNFVFETDRRMKYHLYDDCAYLASDYIDFRIPEDIKDLGNDAVQYFRDWFKSKGYAEQYYAHNLDVPKVTLEYNSHFPPRYKVPPLNESYALIMEMPNSHRVFANTNFTYSEFVKKMEDLKLQFDNSFSCPVTRTLSKFQYLLNMSDYDIAKKLGEIFSADFVKNYGIENVKEKLSISKKIKYQVIELILDYFRWTYKFDNKIFDVTTLEQFGLECCGGCLKKENQELLETSSS